MEKLKVRYIDQINAFQNWALVNPIPTSAKLLWLALIHWCNRLGWKKEFNVPMSLLEASTTSSRQTIIRSRKILQEAGLIRFRTRPGNQSCVYEIVPFAFQNGTQFSTQYDTQSSTQCEHIHKTKDRDIDRDNNIAAAAKKGSEFQKAMETYQENIHPVSGPIERDQLVDLYQDYGYEWLTRAITEAAMNNGRSIRYIMAILQRWRATGAAKPWEKGTKQGWNQQNSKQHAIDSVNRLMAKYEKEEGNENDDENTDPAFDWSFATGISK